MLGQNDGEPRILGSAGRKLMNISIRVSFPEDGKYDWFKALQRIESIGSVETAFYLPQAFLKNVRIEEVLLPFNKIRVKCGSIHMAHVRIDDPFLFEAVLKKTIEIARVLKCDKIVVHPSFAKLEKVKIYIDEIISPMLEKNLIYLCWETFSGKRRFLSGLGEAADFCASRKWHKVCFDFSHIHDQQEKILNDIDKYLDLIKIFHVSNRITGQKLQHLPLFYNGADLDFHQIIRYLKSRGFSGGIVLEYLPEYHHYLAIDAKNIIEKYGRGE